MFWRKKRAGESPSAIHINVLGDDVVAVTIVGEVSHEKLYHLRIGALRALQKMESPCVLIDMSEFAGFTGSPSRTDLDLFEKYDRLIRKFAVVGDPEREGEYLMLLGAGYRKADVRFFPEEDINQAKEWLQV